MALIDAPRYTIVADPASMRWEFYERDLQKFWRDCGQEPLVHVVHWGKLIDRDGDIAPLKKWDEPSILRIESPARDFELVRKLLRAGDRSEGRAPDDWQPPGDRAGWIASPRLMYRGLCHTLSGLATTAGENLLFTADVDDICLACDKNATADRLRDASLPTPESFQPTGAAEALIEQMKNKRQWNEAFVKLAYGSCASGIAVVKPKYYHPHATTSVAKLDGEYHNSFQLREIGAQDVLDLLDFLIGQQAIAQKGVVKLTVDSHNFDVRVVVIRGLVTGTIFRVSPNPMTNLHLGGRRGDEAACRRVIPQRYWLDGLDACVEAAELFDLPAVGIDLAFDRNDYTPQILEVNAFGDFFPNWTNGKGESLHRLEISATARQFGLIE